MPLTKEQIKSAVLQLEPVEREELMEELYVALVPGQQEAIERAWLAEAHRRFADWKAGKVQGVSLDDALAQIRANAAK